MKEMNTLRDGFVFKGPICQFETETQVNDVGFPAEFPVYNRYEKFLKSIISDGAGKSKVLMEDCICLIYRIWKYRYRS